MNDKDSVLRTPSDYHSKDYAHIFGRYWDQYMALCISGNIEICTI